MQFYRNQGGDMHDMQHDDATKQEKLKRLGVVTLGMLQTPPLKESRPEILRTKRRRTGTRNGADLPVPKLLLYRNGATTAP